MIAFLLSAAVIGSIALLHSSHTIFQSVSQTFKRNHLVTYATLNRTELSYQKVKNNLGGRL